MTNPSDSIFQKAVCKLLTEIFDGPPDREAYVLNPGDAGLLKQLESLDAQAASSRPIPGRTTVAAHVDHIHYGLSLLNRWAAGEANPWADADWEASWRRDQVTEADWRALRDRLRQAAEQWRVAAASQTGWNDITAAGTIASVAHAAYHLGAIRQILAAMSLHQG